MTHTSNEQSQLELALAQRFQALRDTERASAPALPELPARAPRRVNRSSLGALALVASMAASVVVLIALPEPQSPEALYLEVMHSGTLITEGFLQTPAGALPESRELPVFEPGRHGDRFGEFN